MLYHYLFSVVAGADNIAGAALAAGVAAGGEFNGAPTAMSHRCPGWPCGGFMPGAVLTGVISLAIAVPGFDGVTVIGVALEAGDVPGGEFNGAPTAMSQR